MKPQAQDFPKAFLSQIAGLVVGTLCVLREPEVRSRFARFASASERPRPCFGACFKRLVRHEGPRSRSLSHSSRLRYKISLFPYRKIQTLDLESCLVLTCKCKGFQCQEQQLLEPVLFSERKSFFFFFFFALSLAQTPVDVMGRSGATPFAPWRDARSARGLRHMWCATAATNRSDRPGPTLRWIPGVPLSWWGPHCPELIESYHGRPFFLQFSRLFVFTILFMPLTVWNQVPKGPSKMLSFFSTCLRVSFFGTKTEHKNAYKLTYDICLAACTLAGPVPSGQTQLSCRRS